MGADQNSFRPHLLHFANLKMHLPPLSQAPTLPGLATTPEPFSVWPSGAPQWAHLPKRQMCAPLGDLAQVPELCSMRSPGDAFSVLTSPGARRVVSDVATAPPPPPWIELCTFSTAWHLRQCAWSLSHCGTHLYPQNWHSTFCRSFRPSAFGSAASVAGGVAAAANGATSAASGVGGFAGLAVAAVGGARAGALPMPRGGSALAQWLHFPNFQRCAPLLGAFGQCPDSDSMALPGACLNVLTSPTCLRDSFTSLPATGPAPAARRRRTAKHFKQLASSFIHCGTHW
mmetsp:Transcript_54797/g.158560  ORF Transcript_54797/g.158560 Transcript_54797/m.158560 type:complete len:286 (-) Transcript_54797:153-1010(-)